MVQLAMVAMMKCPVSTCPSYDDVSTLHPLGLVIDEQGNNERPYKHELIHTLCDRSTPKIIHDYVVKHFDPDFPELTEESINDPEVTKKLHPYLLEREIIFGKLVCPHCGREFPIKERIAHMLLNEDEV